MMDAAPEIADDEILLRHIPGGTWWQAPGPRITSANFQLRPDRGETGVSVTRAKITGPDRLLLILGGDRAKGSRVAGVRVSDVRAMGLKVVALHVDDDSGHAEIQSDQVSLDDHACRKKLAKLFQFVDEPNVP